jgi:negative regulator of flagellin synthesis FlgM
MEPIQPGKKSGRVNQVQGAAKTDSISISPEAVEKSARDHAYDLVSLAPDLRADRVAELKAKINDPSYINDLIVEATADKLMEAFGI